ncbi:MAG TPA: metallophosphoesterase [Polyangia bacterium]|nr:metallophosphoesterase [Polyangia bacterium]
MPAALHGFSIVQLTDIHVGPTIGRRFVEDVVARTNALEPDLVAITGDLVDGHVHDLAESIAPLAQLRARHGVFFVTGNHEYFSGAEAWVNELTRMGIRVLQNERVVIGNAGASFDLAGVDDRSAVHYGGLAPQEAVARALSGRDSSRELVLLAHQPRSALDAESFGVGLQLSGHTHGGQIWPFGLIVRLQQPFTAGLHRHRDAQVYVSRGTGYWGPPMRLAAPSEITHVRLESARALT